ncbi:hypothetical protein F0562_032044 [Nyssa sinensis]|uniref:Uncharacterized protein n=1 Tax=Nyssa sinensis TaxID=561372 RepID=A0A5J5AYH9_9ASTE|nr:hypothetical protein F0562_032044 [Nyssa sinensis]
MVLKVGPSRFVFLPLTSFTYQGGGKSGEATIGCGDGHAFGGGVSISGGWKKMFWEIAMQVEETKMLVGAAMPKVVTIVEVMMVEVKSWKVENVVVKG